MAEERWLWRDEASVPGVLEHAVARLGVRHASLLARLLWNRGVRQPAEVEGFLRPTLARGLRSPHAMADMQRAAARLADAVERRELIAIYGDYDVDGIAGAAQLVLCLRALGCEPLVHIPHRERDGYGVKAATLAQLHTAGARVVVTADCGTADHEALQAGADLGLDVIVCDHHQVTASRPPALAVLNPLQRECGFPFKGLSGAGVVFYLLMGLRMALRERGAANLPDLRQYLDLTALGTVADVVPLREENRVLVAHGLRQLDHTVRPGLVALKERALVERASVQAIGFRLAPRLNASGRVADACLSVELLTTDSPERARVLATELELHNAERRRIEEEMVAEALRLAEMGADGSESSTLVACEGWHAGVVGIVAARLAERYHRPAVVIALDGRYGRGSGRSMGGVDLHGVLVECGDLLEAFGGHRQAVGLTVRSARIAELRRRVDAAVRARAGAAAREPRIEIDAELRIAEITPTLAEGLARLEPFGPGNPEPRFLVRDAEVVGVRVVGDADRPHLKLRVRQDSWTATAIGFGRGRDALLAGSRVDVVCTPRLTRWQGVDRLEIEVVTHRPTSPESVAQVTENTREYAIP